MAYYSELFYSCEIDDCVCGRCFASFFLVCFRGSFSCCCWCYWCVVGVVGGVDVGFGGGVVLTLTVVMG